MPVCNGKYIKANVREFDGDEVPKENEHYACVACITIDSVMRMEKKKLSAGLFRRMQIQNEKDKND